MGVSACLAGNLTSLFSIFSLTPVVTPHHYSEDFRWRVVWLYFICNWSIADISSALFVLRKSVDRFLQLYISNGTVQHKLQRHGPQPVLNEFEQLYLLESLIHNPTMYLQELQSELIELTGSQVHQSTLCRTLQRLGMTRKEVSKVALQQSESVM